MLVTMYVLLCVACGPALNELCILTQGGGTMAAGNIRDLWMPLLCLILLFASVIYGASAICNQLTTMATAWGALSSAEHVANAGAARSGRLGLWRNPQITTYHLDPLGVLQHDPAAAGRVVRLDVNRQIAPVALQVCCLHGVLALRRLVRASGTACCCMRCLQRVAHLCGCILHLMLAT
jgi:hypothetical protein